MGKLNESVSPTVSETIMKSLPFAQPVADPRMSDEDSSSMRTLWLADGKSLPARVTKVERGGIQVSSDEESRFISASDLCTLDRVHFGFGTRKETAWVAQMNANVAKQRSARLPLGPKI
jgi:hypothetical protein